MQKTVIVKLMLDLWEHEMKLKLNWLIHNKRKKKIKPANHLILNMDSKFCACI